MTFLLHFAVATAVFAVIDFVWLGFAANKLYRRFLGGLLRDKFLVPAAVVFYLIFILGLAVFAVQPAVAAGTLYDALWRGGLFGLVCYATYDLTNLATLKRWPLTITLIDMAWGTVLSALVTSVCCLVFAR